MRVRANMCDLCATDGEVRLAKTQYWTPEISKWIDVCPTHKKEVAEVLADTPDCGLEMRDSDFELSGNVDNDLFYQ